MCSSAESSLLEISTKINRQLRDDRQRLSHVVHALILGEENSGKSTVASHLRFLGRSVEPDSFDKVTAKLDIIQFLASQLEKLCLVATGYNRQLSEASLSCAASLRGWLLSSPDAIPPYICEPLNHLRSDSSLIEVWYDVIYDQSIFCESGLSMGFHYFLLKNLDTFCDISYIPTIEDWLHVPKTTEKLISMAEPFSGYYEPASRAHGGLTFSITECGSLSWRGYRRVCESLENIDVVVMTINLANFDWKEGLGMGQSHAPHSMPFHGTVDLFERILWQYNGRIVLIFTGFDFLSAKLQLHSFRDLYGLTLENNDIKDDRDAEEVSQFLIRKHFENYHFILDQRHLRWDTLITKAILDPASSALEQQWKHVVSSFAYGPTMVPIVP